MSNDTPTSTPADTRDPIFGCMDNWYLHMQRKLEGGLESILDPDVVFLSPVVFTPQEGRDITMLYLAAAGGTLGGDADVEAKTTESGSGEFGYIKTILQGHHAMLEFETTVEGKYVNGVDIITCNDEGIITEFKVMMRPLQAVNAVHAQMGAMLERLAKR
jgi:hypothetical protein|tara:strand:+ start:1828 stop:2307 length:480 start_codon:yes stop_codon:yes gene_type:complete